MIAIVAALVAGVGIVLFFAGFDLARRQRPVVDAEQIWARSMAGGARMEDAELQLPFEERILNPLLIRIRGYVQRRTPEGRRASIEEELEQAGRPRGISAADFTTIRYGVGVLLLALAAFVTIPSLNPVEIVVGCVLGAGVGYFAPALWLRRAATRRRNAIRRALPDALDLMVISVEAGLSLDGAIQQVGNKMKGKNPLGEEFVRVITETNLGESRQEALYAMARRTGLEDMNNLVQAIVQSQQMGVAIARMLRIHADGLRTRRRQRASELAAQASLKMMLPMIGCIFPTIWLVIVGPAVLILIAAGHV